MLFHALRLLAAGTPIQKGQLHLLQPKQSCAKLETKIHSLGYCMLYCTEAPPMQSEIQHKETV
jgi:hypothetical protein